MVLVGVVPIGNAFSGFSHRAVITVAAVLVLSNALGNTGVTYHLSQHLSRFSDRPVLLILTLTGLVAFFSAFMNDVGALALIDRKSTRLNSSHVSISYAVFCLRKKKWTI